MAEQAGIESNAPRRSHQRDMRVILEHSSMNEYAWEKLIHDRSSHPRFIGRKRMLTCPGIAAFVRALEVYRLSGNEDFTRIALPVKIFMSA